MKIMGRPKKANAIKAGELQKGLCRFSFIVEKKLVSKIKFNASKEGKTVKAYMNNILESYFNISKEDIKQAAPLAIIQNDDTLNQKKGAKKEHEALLNKYLSSKKS